MKNKKCIKNITICVVICIIAMLLIYEILLGIFGPTVGIRSDDHINNSKEYSAIASIVYEDYQKYDAKYLVYFVSENSNILNCGDDGYKHEIILNDDDNIKLQKILKDYDLDDLYIETIRVYKNFVSFCNVNGRSSIVYSFNNKPPKYINSPYEEKHRTHFYRICDNLYFICTMKLL